MIGKQETPGTNQTSLSEFDKEESVKILVKLLKMKQQNNDERAEFIKLMNARYILEQVIYFELFVYIRFI